MKGPPLQEPRFATITDALAAAAKSRFGLTFIDLHEREQRYSWAEVRARSLAAAAALDVAPGERVAILLPTGISFFDAFFGVLHCGAVPVPLYPPFRLGAIDEYHAHTSAMLERVQARLVITDERVQPFLAPTLERARVACRLADTLVGPGAREWAAGADELAFIQFSSGTTGASKPVAVTQRNLMAQCSALHALMPHGDDEPKNGVLWLPLYHDMGLVGSLLALYYPASLALIPPEVFLTRPALWLRALSRHRATISTAPNFAYSMCAKRIRDGDLADVDLSSWRHALDGAEPISPSATRAFARRFARWGFDERALTPVYGMSEATLAVTFTPPGRGLLTRRLGRRELVSVGRPVPGAEVEVRDDEGRVLPDGEIGRVCIRGPSVTGGYFGGEKIDWLDTGDLGLAMEGELYLTGRRKDLVILRGANHAPEEFEDCLDEVAGVRTGCAVALGLPTEEGEQLLILAEKSGPPDATLAERIGRAVLERSAIRPYCVEILAPGTLPRTSSGKRRRGEALRRYLAGELTRA